MDVVIGPILDMFQDKKIWDILDFTKCSNSEVIKLLIFLPRVSAAELELLSLSQTLPQLGSLILSTIIR